MFPWGNWCQFDVKIGPFPIPKMQASNVEDDFDPSQKSAKPSYDSMIMDEIQEIFEHGNFAWIVDG